MGGIADMDDYWEPGYDESEGVTCNRCGCRGLVWYEIRKPDGNPGWALFTADARRHYCPPASADEFEDLGGAA